MKPTFNSQPFLSDFRKWKLCRWLQRWMLFKLYTYIENTSLPKWHFAQIKNLFKNEMIIPQCWEMQKSLLLDSTMHPLNDNDYHIRWYMRICLKGKCIINDRFWLVTNHKWLRNKTQVSTMVNVTVLVCFSKINNLQNTI